jgi:hypothetical protein
MKNSGLVLMVLFVVLAIYYQGKANDSPTSQADVRPNILFALADDWSWPHASIAHDLGIPGSERTVSPRVRETTL